jgi:hypothetical protein
MRFARYHVIQAHILRVSKRILLSLEMASLTNVWCAARADLSNNKIHDEGAKLLAQLLQINQTIKTVRLRGQPSPYMSMCPQQRI